MAKGQSLQTRFNSRYRIDDETGCWVWTGSKDVDGYGVIWTKERNNNERAHRVSLRLVGRECPDNLMALHQCDNPSCVNPNHLRWGTNKQNQREAVDRGRTGNLSEKRKKFYLSMTNEEFAEWKQKFRNRVGKQLSNLRTAEKIREQYYDK